MALYNFHRVLILAAATFFLAFCLYSFWRYGQQAQSSHLLTALGAALATALAVAYFIYFNHRLRDLRARGLLR